MPWLLKCGLLHLQYGDASMIMKSVTENCELCKKSAFVEEAFVRSTDNEALLRIIDLFECLFPSI
jgi:hypothetical protein